MSLRVNDPPVVAVEVLTHPTIAACNTAAKVARSTSPSTGAATSSASQQLDRPNPRAGVSADCGLFTGVLGTRPRGDWRQLARCAEADPDLFYPEARDTAQTAKSICAVCEVRTDCLATAIATREPHGIWGGLTYRERLTLARGLGRTCHAVTRRLLVGER